jgi:hypothetical protein
MWGKSSEAMRRGSFAAAPGPVFWTIFSDQVESAITPRIMPAFGRRAKDLTRYFVSDSR